MVLIFGFFNFETKLFNLLDIEIADLTTLELQHCNVEKWDFRLPVPGSQQQNLLALSKLLPISKSGLRACDFVSRLSKVRPILKSDPAYRVQTPRFQNPPI
jgi:hypothetical protein